MRSTFGGLNTLVRGIFAQQASLDTVGHNVANANTAGYSRQSVNLSTTMPEYIYGNTGRMQLGTGVSITSITRARDTFVDRQMWKESSTLGYGQSLEDTLGRIEGVFKDTSETGIQTVLNNFWKSWQSLSTNASDYGTRTALRQRGVELVDALQHSTQQLKDMATDLNSVIDIKVNAVNQINSEILSLNKQITKIETGGLSHANDLRDRRDLLVDQLSQLVKIQMSEDQYGNYSIQSNGVTLVDGNGYTELGTQEDTSSPLFTTYQQPVKQIIIKGTSPAQTINFTGGQIAGMMAVRDDATYGIKAYLDKVNTMSQFLLQDFNGIHRSGYGLDDSTGNNFFGADTGAIGAPADGNWIKLLSVSSALFATTPANGLDKIAAKSASGTTQGNASGDLAVKLSEALKTTPSATLSNQSLDSYYNSLVGGLGVQSQNAQRLTENQKVLVNQIENWRQSVSGVNMDEEMSNMIRFQKGYSAAARVLTTMDEMLDKLINGTGVVGR